MCSVSSVSHHRNDGDSAEAGVEPKGSGVQSADVCVCGGGGAHVTHSHTKTSKAIPINVHVSGEPIRNEAKMT